MRDLDMMERGARATNDSSEDRLAVDAFVQVSSVLTGFEVFELFGTGLAEARYRFFLGVVGSDGVGALVERVLALPPDEPERGQALRAEVLADDRLGPPARSLIKLWYLGTWFALPPAWHAVFGGSASDVTTIPGPESYVEGLVWGILGAHPAGAKPQGYGTWAEPPRPIAIRRPDRGPKQGGPA